MGGRRHNAVEVWSQVHEAPGHVRSRTVVVFTSRRVVIASQFKTLKNPRANSFTAMLREAAAKFCSRCSIEEVSGMG
jgi:hypothetical protein